MKILRRSATLRLQLEDKEDPGIVLMAIARVAFGLFSYPLTAQPVSTPTATPPELPSDVAHGLIVHTIEDGEDRLGFNAFVFDHRQCQISAKQETCDTIVVGRGMSDAILAIFLADLSQMITEVSTTSGNTAHTKV